MLGPTLETDRLILRPPCADDIEPYVANMADEGAAHFIGGRQSRPVAWRGLAGIIGAWTLNGFSMFSVIDRATGRWAGRLGPWRPEGWPGTEVGWAITRQFWGRGYATEGAARCMDFAFDELGWTEVIHSIDATNIPSQAVARRLGSTILRQAMLPDPINHEVDIWGQTREQWRARRG